MIIIFYKQPILKYILIFNVSLFIKHIKFIYYSHTLFLNGNLTQNKI